MGERVPGVAADRCGVRSRRRPGAYAATASHGVARETNCEPSPLASTCADVGFASKLQPGVARRIRGDFERATAHLAERRGFRTADPDQPAGVKDPSSCEISNSALPGHHALAAMPIS